MRKFTVGEVMVSRHPGYEAGEYGTGGQGWQECARSDGRDIIQKVDPATAPLSAALGVLGHTEMTAYVGMLDIGQPRPGETAVVSTAAGAVESVAGQIARIKSCRVVGTTGSDAKAELCLREFGDDACINGRRSAIGADAPASPRSARAQSPKRIRTSPTSVRR